MIFRIFISILTISIFEDVAKAHNAVFHEIKPATSLLEIKSLVHPDMLVEIEATAIVVD